MSPDCLFIFNFGVVLLINGSIFLKLILVKFKNNKSFAVAAFDQDNFAF